MKENLTARHKQKAKLEKLDRPPTPLTEFAHKNSILTSYVANNNEVIFISDEVLIQMLEAMAIEIPADILEGAENG